MFGRPQQHSQINTLLRTLYKEQFQNQLHKFHHVYNPDSVQVDSAQLQSTTRQLHQFQNSLPPLPLHTYGPDSNQTYSGQIQLPTHPADNSAASKRVPSLRRKKGCAWTTQEHRLFLHGLTQYGKGHWKSIARYCVVSKTPSQIASHAQKYFLRNNPLKQKKRASIHDITLESEHLVKVELDHQQPSPEPEPENPIQELNHDDSIPHHVDQQHNTIQQLHNDSVPHQVDQQQNTIQQPQINWEDYINLPMQDQLEWPILLDQLELYEQNNCYVPEDPFNSQMQQASDSETLQFNPPDNVNIPPYLMDDFDPFDKSIKPAC